MQFPDICFLNKYLIGDTVLLEPIARYFSEFCDNVYIKTYYPELLENHPSVKAIHYDKDLDEEIRVIDMNPAIKPFHDGFVKEYHNPLSKMCDVVNLSYENVDSPQLFLSREEKEIVQRIREDFWGKRLGIALSTSLEVKNWPHLEKFIAEKCKDYHVFVFGRENDDGKYNWLKNYPVIPVIGESLREAMTDIAAMDLMLGSDTGLMHIAGALSVPILVIGFDWFSSIYEKYKNHTYIKAPMYDGGMKKCSPRLVGKKVRGMLKPKESEEKDISPYQGRFRDQVALFRLDGLGGTITLIDQAKKIYEKTGRPVDLITRGYEDAFVNLPYIRKVHAVGYVNWTECLNKMLNEYDVLAEIRFAPAKWHQRREIFKQDFRDHQLKFDEFPIGFNSYESEGLHHVQLTDRFLGLPYDTIDIDIANIRQYTGQLPSEYIVFSNGVDIQHQDMKQTKQWHGWDQLVKLLPLPIVQIGVSYDTAIEGALDLRGRTKLPELFSILQNAAATICTEGGIMHVCYAVKAKNVFILRGPTRGKLFEYPDHNFIDSYVCDICWWDTEDWYLNCPKKIDAVCMKSISPNRVAFNVKEALA